MTNRTKKSLKKEEILDVKRLKLKKEIEAARRILKKGVEPLEIADKFIHNTFEVLKDSISRQHPDFSPDQIRTKINQLLSLNKRIKLKVKEMDNWQK